MKSCRSRLTLLVNECILKNSKVRCAGADLETIRMIATLKILLAIGDGALPRFEALACSLFSEWDWSFWARLLLAVYDCFVAEVCMLVFRAGLATLSMDSFSRV